MFGENSAATVELQVRYAPMRKRVLLAKCMGHTRHKLHPWIRDEAFGEVVIRADEAQGEPNPRRRELNAKMDQPSVEVTACRTVNP